MTVCRRASAIHRHPCLPEQRIGCPFERPDHRPNASTLDQPATRARLPDAAGALHDVRQFPRAADRHHASELGELNWADAGGQGRGKRTGESYFALLTAP